MTEQPKETFTPGTWGADEDLAKGQRVISDDRGGVVALVVPSYDMTDDQLIGLVEAPDPERDANARLIAKAPELFEALAACITALEECEAGECTEARAARELIAEVHYD